MHIPPYNNKNEPIINIDNHKVPLVYFNIIKLKKNEIYNSEVIGYETCFVPVTGSFQISVGNLNLENIGNRNKNVWDGEPEGVYIPVNEVAEIKCLSEDAEGFIAGAKFDQKLKPFYIGNNDVDIVQYGSDDTKTHRKIKHILGAKQHEQVGRLLVNELYTVGAGGWSGFPPHKHDTDNLPDETRHDEVYNYRFKPGHGFGVQVMQYEDDKEGFGYQLFDGSTIAINKGYHPCVVAPGYEMYYFTILVGLSQRSLVQYFQKTHAYQIETIPGIKDMIAKYK